MLSMEKKQEEEVENQDKGNSRAERNMLEKA